jgi:hypothetical protein
VDSLRVQAKDASHRVADSVHNAKRLIKETKVSALQLFVLAVVVVLFLGTGRDHAGLTIFTLSGTDVAPLRDIIVAVSVAYIILVLVVSPFELLAHARTASRSELFGRFVYLFVLLSFGFSLIYYDLGSKQLWSPNDLSHISAIYVTLGTIASNGFAGIEPKSDWLRVVISLQVIVDIVLVVFVGAIALQRYGERPSRSNTGQSDRAGTS